MNRRELQDNIKSILDKEIMVLFTQKNESYGDADDAFYNFRKAADLLFSGDDYPDQFTILMAYVMKHIIALSNRNFEDFEFRQRCKDIIVYMLIAMSMDDERREYKHE